MRTEIRKFRISAKSTIFYNLDAILSVGFRIRSKQGTLFRQWAIERLRNYIVKGFDIDSERLKGNGGGQYWYELLNTIKDIRSSEKVLYRQVLDLYATSVDYNATDEETILFFKMVQNKHHYATKSHARPSTNIFSYFQPDFQLRFLNLKVKVKVIPILSPISRLSLNPLSLNPSSFLHR